MRIPVQIPRLGVNKDGPFGAQPILSTRDARNFRFIDPTNSRGRGAQRSGLSFFTSTQINASGKVKHAQVITYDNKNVDYVALAAAAVNELWTFTPDAPFSAFYTETDRQGNVWFSVNRKNLQKLNSAGKELQQIQLPNTLEAGTQVENQIVRAVHVDDFDHLYAASDFGTKLQFKGAVEDASITAWVPSQDEEKEETMDQLWTVKTGRRVPRLKVFDGLLYSVQNDDSNLRAYVTVYGQLDSAVGGIQTLEFEVPYPCEDVDIKEGGRMVTSHPAFADRGTTPTSPLSTARAVGFTPTDLASHEKRIWCWLHADDLKLEDEDIEEGDAVFIWKDRSGNGRHLYADPDTNPPTYAEKAFSSLPGVRFAGQDATQSLISAANLGTALGFEDLQRSLLPAYANSQFCIFILLRAVGGPAQTLLQQDTDNQAIQARYIGINRKEGDLFGGTDPEDGVAGQISVREDLDSAGIVIANGTWTEATKTLTSAGAWTNYTFSAGDTFVATGGTNVTTGIFVVASKVDSDSITLTTSLSAIAADLGTGDIAGHLTHLADGAGTGGEGGPQPNAGYYGTLSPTDDMNVALITYLDCGSVIPGNSGVAFTRSIWRISGDPKDRWDGDDNRTDGPTTLGKPFDANFKYFKGYIRQILVLKDYQTSPEDSRVLTHPQDPDEAFSGSSDTEMEKLEGYIMNEAGYAHILPDNSASFGRDDATVFGPHPYASVSQGGAAAPLATGQADVNDLNNVGRLLCMWDSSGTLEWVKVNDTGTGHGAKFDSNGDIFSIGANDSDTFATVRKYTDGDTAPTTAWGPTSLASDFGALGDSDLQTFHPLSRVDAKDNWYIPLVISSGSGGEEAGLFIFDTDGNQQMGGDPFEATEAGANYGMSSIALQPAGLVPDYEGDLTDEVVEHVYLGMERSTNVSGVVDLVRKVRLVSATQNTDPPRKTTIIAIGGQDFNVVTSSGKTNPATDLNWAANNQFVDSTVNFEEMFFTDGVEYFSYNPRTDVVAVWESESSGEIPPRCALIATFGGRIVVARNKDSPQQWHMSKIGEPRNWDLFPGVITPDSAFSGITALAGQVPDIVNGLGPVNDDLMYILCDHSVYRLTGDPGGNGRFDLLTNVVGGAFGRAHCVDPRGNFYFLSTRGGLYVIPPGGVPVPVTESTIEDDLEKIDFGTFYVELIWNEQREGLHILQMPFGAGGTLVDHWFFDAKHGGIWPDRFGVAGTDNIQPTCAVVVDGDLPADRVLLFGGEDGFLRKWDKDAAKDTKGDSSDLAIKSRCLFGPFTGPTEASRYVFSELEVVLADNLGGGWWKMYASDTPDTLGPAKASGTLVPGRTPSIRERVVGSYVWIELGNASANERWAIEKIMIRAEPMGSQVPA